MFQMRMKNRKNNNAMYKVVIIRMALGDTVVEVEEEEEAEDGYSRQCGKDRRTRGEDSR